MTNLTQKNTDLITHIIGQKIYSFEQVTSTNDIAKKLASEGAKEGTIVVAETQSRGRGRSGSKWLSPKGGLWFSVILHPNINPKDSPKLIFVGAVAVAKTIIKLCKLNVVIKWPNDIVINNKKLCGILTEASTRKNNLAFIILGVGINVNIDIENFPDDLQGKITSLKEEMKKEVSRETLFQAILVELEYYYNVFTYQKFDVILTEWKKLSVILKKYLKVKSFDEIIDGQVIDVDQDGALLIKIKDGSIKRVISGQVLIQRNGEI